MQHLPLWFSISFKSGIKKLGFGIDGRIEYVQNLFRLKMEGNTLY